MDQPQDNITNTTDRPASSPASQAHPSLLSEAVSSPASQAHPSLLSEAVSSPASQAHPSLLSEAVSSPAHPSLLSEAVPVILDYETYQEINLLRSRFRSYSSLVLRNQEELGRIQIKIDHAQKCLEEIIDLGRIGIKNLEELDRVLTGFQSCKHFIDEIDRQKVVYQSFVDRGDKYQTELEKIILQKDHLEAAFGIQPDQAIGMAPSENDDWASRSMHERHDRDHYHRSRFNRDPFERERRSRFDDYYHDPYYLNGSRKDYMEDTTLRTDKGGNTIQRAGNGEDGCLDICDENQSTDIEVRIPEDLCVDSESNDAAIIQDLDDIGEI